MSKKEKINSLCYHIAQATINDDIKKALALTHKLKQALLDVDRDMQMYDRHYAELLYDTYQSTFETKF